MAFPLAPSLARRVRWGRPTTAAVVTTVVSGVVVEIGSPCVTLSVVPKSRHCGSQIKG